MRDLVEVAFGHVGLEWQEYVEVDPAFIRPAEVEILLADPSKAKQELGWRHKVGFEELVTMMVDSDMERLGNRK